jgi:hypothetical protein
MWLDDLNWPKLKGEGYTETSPDDWNYNCIAWAANDKSKWWWPLSKAPNGNEAYWPRKAPKKKSIDAFVKAFGLLGYQRCKNDDPSHEEGYEKVAIYALDGVPKHAARQLPNGKWTHKMGQCIDLESNLPAVEGPSYGVVVRVLRRKRR